MNCITSNSHTRAFPRVHNGSAPKSKLTLFMLVLTAVLLVVCPALVSAQTTATISGTIQDTKGKLIVGALVKITNESTGVSETAKTNGAGLYAFPSLNPGTYDIEASAKGFSPKLVTGVDLHTGDQRTVPAFELAVGSETTVVTVVADENMIPVESGERSAVLDSAQINNLALTGRDATELLKVLPGATSASNGLSNGPSFTDLSITVQQSSIGMGVDINGAVNRGGTALLMDGASIIDPGDMASSLSLVDPNFTQEVSVQASNFSAEIANGPVVVSSISKSGGEHYRGEVYFDARNNVLDANDWHDNHIGNAQGPASYYYPGGDAGGIVPFTHRKLFVWGGMELWRQNLGNANTLSSWIPSPEMMGGNFSSNNADNNILCPTGFSAGSGGIDCDEITTDMILPDGSTPTTVAGNTGGIIPTGFIDAGGAALAKIWPTANFLPYAPGNGQHYNYIAPVPGLNNGWVWRARVDYNFSDKSKVFVAYQRDHNAELASGNGAHLYWLPNGSIPYPGGGEQQVFNGKVIAGHFVHTFNAAATNDLMAAWSYGSFPFSEPNASAAFRSTLGYPSSYGSVFGNAVNIPAFSSAGNQTFPDFSQASIFDNPVGMYAVRKAAPQFSDTYTRIWGKHTVKLGAYTQNDDNFQSTFATYQDGNVGNFAGQNYNYFNTGQKVGSQGNPVANLVIGSTSSYSENNSSPIADTAQQTTAFFYDDTYKASRHLTVEVGARAEYVGHWYDRGGTGMAVFIPSLVQTDHNAGAYAPGFRWHGIDPGVPLSGQPNRLAFVSPRFGISYDLFGNGNTVIRGGWGAYRFVTQVNDVSPPLVTAQHVLSFQGLGNQKSVLLSQIGSLPKPGTSFFGQQGGQNGFGPTDYTQPKTFAYNFTIDQKLKWHTQFDLAYVGSQTDELPDASEGIEGSVFSGLADLNKTPIGALFLPDPITGTTLTNPENFSVLLNGNPSGNSQSDYHPYGYAYGANTVEQIHGSSYTNYNALQAVWTKTSGRLTFNLNGTWSKTLGNSLQANPYVAGGENYGPVAIDRPLVFNSSYTYTTGRLHTGSEILNYFGGGWTISGISTWQAGGSLPALLGNGVPNFGLGLTYALPQGGVNNNSTVPLALQGWVNNNVGTPTYFGTDESSLVILPKLTCNPNSGLAHYQRINLNCFSAPAIGTQGGQSYPYMSMGAYFDNDLAVFKSFTIHDQQKVQLRISAFDWMNHPLPQFSGQSVVNLHYYMDYTSKTITTNYAPGATLPQPLFGKMDDKTHAGYQRIITLNVKYSF